MRNIPTESREELGAAQFILKEGYSDFIWALRSKDKPEVPKASISWPFIRATDRPTNVVKLPKRKSEK